MENGVDLIICPMIRNSLGYRHLFLYIGTHFKAQSSQGPWVAQSKLNF